MHSMFIRRDRNSEWHKTVSKRLVATYITLLCTLSPDHLKKRGLLPVKIIETVFLCRDAQVHRALLAVKVRLPNAWHVFAPHSIPACVEEGKMSHVIHPDFGRRVHFMHLSSSVMSDTFVWAHGIVGANDRRAHRGHSIVALFPQSSPIFEW